MRASRGGNARLAEQLALVALLSAACGTHDAEGPRWQRLARGFEGAGELDDGHAQDGVWRVRVGELAGEGFVAAPGEPAVVTADIPARSALRIHAAARALEPGAGETVVLAVSLDGTELVRHELAAGPRAPGAWLSLDLPAEGKDRARLEFRCEGPAARVAILAPAIGPRHPGRYGARPWGDDGRPDVVLFLADTFRADNLSAWGGEHGASPNLDRLAARGVRFLRSWAPSSWTLPSQASMLTGVHPLQHGAVKVRLSVDPALTSLAEHLAAHGYRTGAVTDSGFVSASYGFDQGFGWFEELPRRDLGATFEAAERFLAADDGRPVFLFVHTYRTHAPYTTGAEEDPARWREVEERIRVAMEERLAERGGPDWESPATKLAEREALVAAEFADEHRALYLETVRDLDRRFAAWWEGPGAHGLAESGVLVFTSDHGEAFGEHGEMKHGGELWEVRTRVPLLVVGPRLSPRDVERAATLVDLPRTVAALAGVAPHASWLGDDLMTLDTERPVFCYSNELRSLGGRMTVVDGTRKVFVVCDPEVLRDGDVDRAFDLAADPAELRDLADEEAAWAAELTRRHAARAAELARPLVDASGVRLAREESERLRALGYGGG